jgi:hypothetical protein
VLRETRMRAQTVLLAVTRGRMKTQCSDDTFT